MAEPPVPLPVSFADGRAALTVGPRALTPLASLERLEVEVPKLRGPVELGATPERFRNRRCRLTSAVVRVDPAGLATALAPGALGRAGISEARVALADGHVLLRARASVGGREADFTARVFLAPATARRVRVSIEDIRVYGFLPAPAPLLGGAIMSAAGFGGAGPGRATARWSAEIDVLDLTLLETFAASGWRLPDASGARLRAVTVTPAGIALEWGSEARGRASVVEEITATGAPTPFDEAEGLLARGDFAGALAGYRSAARAKGDWHAECRVLELLLAGTESLSEVEAQATRLSQRSPDLPLVWLARAVAAAERGQPAAAAEAYERAAETATRARENEDASLARVSAAREWLRAGQGAAARPLLETVLAARPGDRRASELLELVLSGLVPQAAPAAGGAAHATNGANGTNGAPQGIAAPELTPVPAASAAPETTPAPAETTPVPETTPAPAETTPVPEASAAPETAPAAEAARAAPWPAPDPQLDEPSASEHESPVTEQMTPLAVARAEAEHAETTGTLDEAAAALRRAIELTGDAAERADLARRLAGVCGRLGDEPGALAALRLFLDNATAGPAVAGAWERLVELHARRGDPQAAARALIASADDARSGSGERERGAALVAAAEILRKRVNLPGDAVMLLERAIALDPHSSEALEALEAIAVEAGDWERLADVLERKVGAVARGPVEQEDLLVRLAEVYDRHLGRADRARDAHERALGIDPALRASLLWLARDAWTRGDDAAARARYDSLAATPDGAGLPAADREETHVRLGALARRAGDDGAAEGQAERALELAPGSAPALDLLIELYEAQARHGELADALGRRAGADPDPAARAALLRRQAAALEQSGQVGPAAVLLRGLSDTDPAARPALERMAETVRASGDRAALAAVLEPLGELLTVSGDLDEADRVLAARIELAPEGAAAALHTERARLRLLGPGGAAAALAVLRAVPVASLPEEGLVLRADLGERQRSADDAAPALEELLARARAAGQTFAAQEIEARLHDLAEKTRPRGPASLEDLEQALTTDPTDADAAEELASLYGQIDDPHHRAEALSGLLRRALGLSPERRKAIYAAMGASAEASGDLERAEKAYWRAATIEAEPALRANFLVAHARVLLARGEVQTAITELEEAISRVPHHAGALALLADLTYRTQDFARARQLYAELEAAPDAADVIAREHLVQRRAVLAEAQGDSADAEAFYRELAILNPRQAEARRALAEIALRRGDFAAAALRLEEVLRLLPLDALAELLEVRHRLGTVYVQLGDWGSARYYLELVLSQDPSRLAAMELLVEVYERMALYREAASACGRLSRLYFEPARRAAILYRQGEILANHLGAESAAFEAFLKSADLDPRFVPTLVRLVRHFWMRGDWDALAEVAADLAAAGYVAGEDAELAARLAVGATLTARAASPANPRLGLKPYPFDAAVAARALAEAAAHVDGDPEKLDALLAPIVEWSNGAMAAVEEELAACAVEDPADTGALRALARLAERADRTDQMRVALSLLAFVDPEGAAAKRLAPLGAAGEAAPAAVAVGGAADHPGLRGAGAAACLRRVLAGLAAPLLGFGEGATAGAAAASAPAPAASDAVLALVRASELERLGRLLGAPPFVAVVDPDETTRAAVTAAADTRPATLRVTAAAANLAERAFTFVAARALEELRSGLPAVRRLPAAQADDMLAGALAALGGGKPEGERAEAVARWMSDAEAAAALPAGAERQRLVDDLRTVVAAGPRWEPFFEAAQDTANRIALLACRSPAEALEGLAREDVLLAQAEPASADARRAFLRTAPVRELVRFMLSGDYAQGLAPLARGRGFAPPAGPPQRD